MTSNNNISIQQEFEVSPPLLWKYLTQLEHMKKWFFAALTSFEPTRGFKTFFTFQYNNKTFTHQWEVREVIM